MRKKILYIIANPFSFSRRSVGGNISSATGVINGFIADGYQVDIVSDSFIPTLTKIDNNLKTIFYPFRILRSIIPYRIKGFLGRITLKIDSIFFQIVMKYRVMSLLKYNQYNFVYMRASFNGHAIVGPLKKFSIPLVLEVNKPLSMGVYNNDDAHNWPDEGTRIKVPRSEKLQYDAATLITVDSSIRAKWITDFVGNLYNQKMIINPNGVDVNMFCPSEVDQKLRLSFGVKDTEILVGMASSFRWYNDINEMCQIFKAIVKQNDSIKFLIITGDAEKKVEISNLIVSHGIEQNVKILLQIPFDRMPQHLNCCDILISHFNFHGKWPHNCSIKHLEYLSMGKPTVATDVGEVNFAVEHNINGLLTGEGDVNGFVDAVLSLASDRNLRIKFGVAGRKKAVNCLTWKQNTAKIISGLNGGK